MKNREKQHKTNPIIFWTNKQGLRASGLSLLPLALRPLLLAFLMTGFVFILQNSYTKSVSAASITLTIPNGISLSIKPEDKATFNKSEESTLSVKSDANFGYTLSIKSKDNINSNNLVNGSSKLTSISSPMSESDFSNSAENNTWGYLPSKLNSSDNTDFQPGPTESDSTLDKTNAANTSASNDYKITLAAKVDNTIPTGSYKNTFILTASANTVSYSITYNLNEGSWTDKSPQTGTTTENSIKISNVAPTRSGYEFKGWCSVETSNDTCSNGTIYQPDGDYKLINGTNNLNLWAMWKSTIQDAQNFSCNLSSGKTSTIKDSRDGNTYTVAKLADGKCWMTQNLKIANKILTPEDSDVASSFNLPASSASGFSGYDFSGVYIDTTWGGYYTWFAATAGEGKQSMSSGEVSHSICPAGWRLPTKAEFDNLISKQGAANMTKSPANFVLSGYYGGSLVSQTSYGGYWSSTAYGNNYAYGLEVDSSNAYTDYTSKYYGDSVRCVSRQ